jgi:molecular chaperone DnaK
MAMRNPNMSPAKFKTLLEDFQQTIFALGTDVYQQANDDNLKAEDLTNINITQEYPHPVDATQVPLFNIDLDEENNSQADYEKIE